MDADGDGVADDFYWSDPEDDANGTLVQVARSSDGLASSAVGLVGFFGFGGPIDAADLDADGINEVFFALSGNTLLSGVILDLDGCDLRALSTDDPAYDYGDGVFTYPHFAGGNGCAPTGCFNPVICRAGDTVPEIVLTQIYPVTSALDPDFDPEFWETVPRDDLPVYFGQSVVEVRDGAAITIDRTEQFETVTGDVGDWIAIDGVECSRTLALDLECGVAPPPLSEVDGWTLGETPEPPIVDGSPRVWRWQRDDDGATVELQNPGSAPAGDGDGGDLTIDGRTARIGATGPGGWRPWFIQWTTTDPPIETCDEWTLTSAHLDGVDLADFAASALGASEVEWFSGFPPQPAVSDERLLEIGTALRDDLIAWTSGAAGPPSILLEPELRRFFQATELEPSSAGELVGVDEWVFGVFDLLSVFPGDLEWDVVVGPHNVCAGSVPRQPADELQFMHQVSLVPRELPLQTCLQWLSVDLFLDDFETVRAIRVDSFEP